MNIKISCTICHGRGSLPKNTYYFGYGESNKKFCSCSAGKKQFFNWKKKLTKQRKTNRYKGVKLSDSSDFIKGKFIDDLNKKPLLKSECSEYLAKWYEKKILGIGLYFFGSKNSEKTLTASILAGELRMKEVADVLFLNVPKLQKKLSSSNSPVTLNKIKQAELLILDDLGGEKSSARFTGFLYQIIDYRWRHRKPVIVTSRYSLSDISTFYPPHICRCLTGRLKPIEC